MAKTRSDKDKDRHLNNQLAELTDQIMDGKIENIEDHEMDNLELKTLAKTISLMKNGFEVEVLDRNTNTSMKRRINAEFHEMAMNSEENWMSRVFSWSNRRQMLSVGFAVAAILVIAVIVPYLGNSGQDIVGAASGSIKYIPIILLVIVAIIAAFWKGK